MFTLIMCFVGFAAVLVVMILYSAAGGWNFLLLPKWVKKTVDKARD